MRIQFKANEVLKRYENPSLDISLDDGQTADLPDEAAKGLVKDFPQNFSFVGKKSEKEKRDTPVVDRAIKSSKSTLKKK